jgi:hypothetical protein
MVSGSTGAAQGGSQRDSLRARGKIAPSAPCRCAVPPQPGSSRDAEASKPTPKTWLGDSPLSGQLS